VIAPMMTARLSAIAKSAPSVARIWLRSAARGTSASATNIDAAPPRPLKNATNSGIEVIGTLTAIHQPITEPSTMAPTASTWLW
jgi:hypothetical protein